MLDAEDIKTGPYAVVFSGGGALGAWEVGALKAVIEAHDGLWPEVVTGASAGAFNAAGLCAGMEPDDLIRMWADLTNESVYATNIDLDAVKIGAATGFGWDILKRIWSRDFERRSVKDLIWDQVEHKRSYFDTAPLKKTLTGLLEGREGVFLRSPIKLAISTAEIATGDVSLFYKLPPAEKITPTMSRGRFKWEKITGLNPLIQALMGTSALPLLFPPMNTYYDGGTLLNQPITPATKMGAKRLYVLIPSAPGFRATGNLIDLASSLLTTFLASSLDAQMRAIGAMNLTTNRLIAQIDALPEPDRTASQAQRDGLMAGLVQLCVIRPPMPLEDALGINLLSFGKEVHKMVDNGKTAGRERLKWFDASEPKTWDAYMDDSGQIV